MDLISNYLLDLKNEHKLWHGMHRQEIDIDNIDDNDNKTVKTKKFPSTFKNPTTKHNKNT